MSGAMQPLPFPSGGMPAALRGDDGGFPTPFTCSFPAGKPGTSWPIPDFHKGEKEGGDNHNTFSNLWLHLRCRLIKSMVSEVVCWERLD